MPAISLPRRSQKPCFVRSDLGGGRVSLTSTPSTISSFGMVATDPSPSLWRL